MKIRISFYQTAYTMTMSLKWKTLKWHKGVDNFSGELQAVLDWPPQWAMCYQLDLIISLSILTSFWMLRAPKCWLKYLFCRCQPFLLIFNVFCWFSSENKKKRLKKQYFVWVDQHSGYRDKIIISYKLTTCPYIKYRIPRIVLTIVGISEY